MSTPAIATDALTKTYGTGETDPVKAAKLVKDGPPR